MREGEDFGWVWGELAKTQEPRTEGGAWESKQTSGAVLGEGQSWELLFPLDRKRNGVGVRGQACRS